jgi:hypothetical protein
MVPFRVYDNEKKQMWIVLNYHPNDGEGGSYLVAREESSEHDGIMKILPATSMNGYRLVDFLEEIEEMNS